MIRSIHIIFLKIGWYLQYYGNAPHSATLRLLNAFWAFIHLAFDITSSFKGNFVRM